MSSNPMLAHDLIRKLPRAMADMYRGATDNASFRGIEDAVALGILTEAQAAEVLRRIAFRAFEAANPVAAEVGHA